jgi:hypothetical protein
LTESRGIKSFLSTAEKKDLVNFIAATGENYERYLEYCKQRGWRPFTAKYLHTWIQRRRSKVQDARQEHREEVRKMSMYDRERRVNDLESIADTLKKSMDKVSDDPKTLVALSEQLRKTFEAIAKERGEWLKEAPIQTGPTARDRLKAGLDSYLAEAKEAKVIDGTARVIVAAN